MPLERWLYVIRLRLRSLFRRDRVEDELREEFDDHIERKTQELIERGMTASAAREAALRAFGGVEQRKEECRDRRGVRLLEEFVADLRYGARAFARTPAFSGVALLSLALGIGANTAMFTLVDALLLKALPVERPDELRVLTIVIRVDGRDRKTMNALPYSLLRPVRENSDVFADTLAFAPLPDGEIRVGESATRSPSAARETVSSAVFVSENYFRMLGVEPQRGRVFEEGDADASVAVIGDALWRREFAADANIIGQPLVVNDAIFTIIGVAPEGFGGLTVGHISDVFLPLEAMSVAQPGLVTLADRANWRVHLVGRLKPGMSDLEAADRLTALYSKVERTGARLPPSIVRLRPLEEGLSDLRAQLLQPLSVLMAMVGLLLLVACANVAVMLMSRASARKGEIVMRVTMGAGRGRLIRQLVTETVLMTAAAAALGAIIASWATQGIVAMLPAGTTRGLALMIDQRALWFTTAVALIAAIIAGLAPALHASKVDIAGALRDRRAGGTAGGGGHAGRWFVVAQVALAVTLTVAAGLLARTLHALSAVDPGFDVDDLIVAEVNPGARGYTDRQLAAYYRQVLDRLRAMPTTQSVTLLQFSFLTNARTTGTISIPGFTAASDADRWINVYQVGPQFFSTLGMRPLQGRDFEDADFFGPPAVAALNERAARHFFGDVNPIGRLVQDGTRTFEIVAIVRDARHSTLRDDPVATLFVPYTAAGRTRMTYAVRQRPQVTGIDDPVAVSDAIRPLDRHVPVHTTSLKLLFRNNLERERLLAVIAAFFAAAALFLLSLGLYGVMSYWVTERTSEIGVRLALGAHRAKVVWDVLHHPMRFVLVGGAIGLVITATTSRLIANLLFGLAWLDPLAIIGALVVLTVVAAVAAAVPALRASRVDPLIALRCE